jgi:hypothetical protein
VTWRVDLPRRTSLTVNIIIIIITITIIIIITTVFHRRPLPRTPRRPFRRTPVSPRRGKEMILLPSPLRMMRQARDEAEGRRQAEEELEEAQVRISEMVSPLRALPSAPPQPTRRVRPRRRRGGRRPPRLRGLRATGSTRGRVTLWGRSGPR